MTKTIQCISPVDGRVYAERRALPLDEAQFAVAQARAAQKGWAALPLAERIARVNAGIAALNEMKDAVVEELAWQMGRPDPLRRRIRRHERARGLHGRDRRDRPRPDGDRGQRHRVGAISRASRSAWC